MVARRVLDVDAETGAVWLGLAPKRLCESKASY